MASHVLGAHYVLSCANCTRGRREPQVDSLEDLDDHIVHISADFAFILLGGEETERQQAKVLLHVAGLFKKLAPLQERMRCKNTGH